MLPAGISSWSDQCIQTEIFRNKFSRLKRIEDGVRLPQINRLHNSAFWDFFKSIFLYDVNEALHSKLRSIKAELRRSQPGFALKSFAAVRPAIYPCSKLQGILAKANKMEDYNGKTQTFGSDEGENQNPSL